MEKINIKLMSDLIEPGSKVLDLDVAQANFLIFKRT